MSINTVENIYYLGPDGSNGHNAMLKFIELCDIQAQNLIAEKSIKSVLEAFKKDKNSLCVLPIENSIEGIVRETIDNFLKVSDNSIQIQAEYTLPIHHMMLAKTTDKTKIKKVISHPQALAQCGNHLFKNFPNVELKEVSSTSYAAQKVALENDETLAALANETCAELFGLNILEKDMNDEKGNKTRFYLFCRENLTEKETGKTAVVLSTKNQPGALCEVLKIYSKHSINLTYIDSRPSKKKMGEYLFFMELDGLKDEERIKSALDDLNEYVDFIKILGSFKICN